MNTMEKLNAYGSALTKWAAKKNRHDLASANGKPEKKPLESEPMPNQFGVGASEMEWAEKIRRKILAPKPVVPTLESQLPPKTIKMPVRKIV